MTFSGVGALGNSSTTTTSGSNISDAKVDDDSFQKELEEYFFESPAQRMFDNWLHSHGISKEQYDAMSPEEKEAIRKKFAEEMERKAQEKAGTFVRM